MEEHFCYIEDINGGYFCPEEDKEYFLNEYEVTKNAGGNICASGTKEELEKEFEVMLPLFTKK